MTAPVSLPLTSRRKCSESAGDPLGRYYTADALVAVVVARLLERRLICSTSAVVEPSAGGGAFVRALKAAGCPVDAVDIDAGAEGLRLADRAHHGDWAQVGPSLPGPTRDAVVGNPPFGGPIRPGYPLPVGGVSYLGARHALIAVDVAPVVALILPGGWATAHPISQPGPMELWADAGRLPTEIWPTKGRAWKNVRDPAVFLWHPHDRPGPTVIGAPLVWR